MVSKTIVGITIGLALSACCGVRLASANEPAGVFALVIGINDYGGENNLAGAVNDANLMEQLARDLHARKIVALTNAQAKRKAIDEGWKSIVAASRPGDLILVTYAGHGAQMPERVAGSEADHLDEYFKLGGYATDAKENIVDDQWATWFSEVKDRQVLFVADACHSGTMTRSAGEKKYASDGRSAIFGENIPFVSEDIPLMSDRNPQPHVVFLGAAPENRKIPEVQVEGDQHGALTVAFDLAVRGGADADGDGIVSVGELFNSVRSNVKLLSDDAGKPVLEAPGAMARPLFQSLAYKAPPALASTVAIVEHVSRTEQQAKEDLLGLKIAPENRADFIWNQTRRVLIRTVEGGGQVVAEDVESGADVRGELQRWELRANLAKLRPARSNIQFAVRPVNPTSPPCSETGAKCQTGDHVRFTWPEPPTGRYVTVINLSSKGVLFDLTPKNSSPTMCTCVRPPYGIEHVAMLVTDKPIAISTDKDGKGSIGGNLEVLQKVMASPNSQVDWLALYTANGPGVCPAQGDLSKCPP